MKKLRNVFLLFVVCFSMFCVGISASTAAELTEVPKVADMRASYFSKPDGAEENFVGYLYGGTEITATKYNNSFSSFDYSGKEYYIYNSRLDDVVRYVVSDIAYMKKQPDAESVTVAELYWSTPLTLLSFEKDGYYYCEYNGKQGYVEASSIGYVIKMTTCTSSSVYSYASSDAPILEKYIPAQDVTVQYSGSSWIRVEYNGKTGYIYTNNLKYPTFNLNGTLYSSPENLYNDVVAAQVYQQVSLMAVNDAMNFAMIQDDAGEIYWVKASQLTSTKSYTTKYVAGNRETLYKEPNTSSDNFTIRYMEEIMLGQAVSSSADGSWIEVIYKGEDYYIWSVSGENAFVDEKSTYTYVADTQYAQEVIDFATEIALEWDTVYTWNEGLGIPDKDGRRQFDCSGFVSYVLDNVMRKYNPLYDISAGLLTMFYETDIVYNAGYNGEFRVIEINPANKRPGDVLFFDADEDGIVDHCGIYLGDGEYVHCTTDFETGVLIALLDDIRTEILISVKRFFPETVVEANAQLCTIAPAKLYAERDSESQVLYNFSTNEAVTLHFVTDNGWSYATINGKTGFVFTSNIGEDVFPDEPVASIKLSDGKPQISWNTVENATKYSIYRSTSQNGEYKCIITTTSLSYTDKSTSLVNGTTYYYKVRSVNESGYSAYSNCVKIAPLGKPTVSALLTASGKPQVLWDAVEGATKYSIYRSTAYDGTYKLIATTQDLSYMDQSTSLVAGKKYYYRVKAVNANGYSAYSSVVNVLFLKNASILSSLLNGNPRITWVAVPGATKYSVYRATSANGEYKCIATVNALEYIDLYNGLVDGQAYYYKVRARSESGYAGYSNYGKAVPVGKPVISVTRTSSGNPKISWESVAGATKYSVFRSTSYNGTYTLIKTVTGLSFTDTGSLTDGKMYYYKVKAGNTKGYSAYSAYAKVLLLDKAVISAALENGCAKLSWKAVSGATKYSIYRATSANGEYKCIDTVESLSYTDKSAKVEKGTAYYYKVRARSASGYADASNYVKVIPLAKPVITVTRTSSGSPKISWEAVKSATKYSVYRSTSYNGTYTLIKTVTGLSFTDTGSLTDGEMYFYKVKAANANGYSAYSAYAKVLLLNEAVISATLEDGYAKLSWKAVSGATKYSIYRATSANGEYKCIATVDGLSCTDKAAKLEKGTAYYYKVRAKSADGYAEASNYVKAVPLAKPVITVTRTSSGSPKISWEAVKSATKYSVYRSTSYNGTYTLIKTVTGLSFTDTSSLTDGEMYFYKVKAVNANGYSAYSAYAKVLLLDKAVISATLENGCAKLSWKAVSGATKYSIYRATSADGEYKCIDTVESLSYTDKSVKVEKGTAYYYKVRARSADGYADASNYVKAVPLAKPVITVTRTSSGSPKISWEAVKSATKYSVYRSTSYNGTYTLIKTVTGLSFTDTSSLTDGEMYFYKVKAGNANGYSAYSAYSKVLLLDKPVISATLEDGYAKLSWNAVPGATKYNVYRATSANGEYTRIKIAEGLSYTDKNAKLEKGKTYYYKVKAQSADGYSAFSNYVAVAPIAKPTVSASLSGGNPKISWNTVSGATKYNIYRSDSLNGTYKLIKTTTVLSYTDTSSTLENGKTYYYKVKAGNAKGLSAFGNAVYIKVVR